MTVKITSSDWPGHNRIIHADLPITLDLPDGNSFELKMLDDDWTEIILLLRAPEEDAECLWSKDYAMQQVEDL